MKNNKHDLTLGISTVPIPPPTSGQSCAVYGKNSTSSIKRKGDPLVNRRLTKRATLNSGSFQSKFHSPREVNDLLTRCPRSDMCYVQLLASSSSGQSVGREATKEVLSHGNIHGLLPDPPTTTETEAPLIPFHEKSMSHDGVLTTVPSATSDMGEHTANLQAKVETSLSHPQILPTKMNEVSRPKPPSSKSTSVNATSLPLRSSFTPGSSLQRSHNTSTNFTFSSLASTPLSHPSVTGSFIKATSIGMSPSSISTSGTPKWLGGIPLASPSKASAQFSPRRPPLLSPATSTILAASSSAIDGTMAVVEGSTASPKLGLQRILPSHIDLSSEVASITQTFATMSPRDREEPPHLGSSRLAGIGFSDGSYTPIVPRALANSRGTSRSRFSRRTHQEQYQELYINISKIDAEIGTDSKGQGMAQEGDEDYTKIAEHLYISGERTGNNSELLKKLGVTHIVNAAWSLSSKNDDQFVHLNLSLRDNVSQEITSILHDTNAFIKEAHRSNGVVLVHCIKGISRSASIVLAHLMDAHQWGFEVAFRHLKSLRPIIDPNPSFVMQLKDWYDITLVSGLADEAPQGVTTSTLVCNGYETGDE